MARCPDNEFGFTFTNVQIFRDQELGHGSYGAVYRAKCDSLPCAAKLIYPVLFASNVRAQQAVSHPGKEHRQPIRRFEAECRFLSEVKHPNIVQYLGVYHDPETNVPVLLMELMDESLTHFLETPHCQNSILFHIQVNILHDTALALAFLHSNRITHRDLSSNNVLLIAGNRAKVTDFGMSKFADTAAPHLASLTQTPGTPAYMPPEALEEPPVYSEKLDCFSFGVLIVQTITREFPKPTERFQIMELPHPTQPSRLLQARVAVPELERRQSHISLIPTAHPLRQIALDCLKDKDVERPTAEQLCETLKQFKSTPLYASSVQQIRDREIQLRTQRKSIQENDQQLHDKDRQLQDKDRQLQDKERQLQDKDRQLQDKERQLQDKNRQLEDKDRQLQDKNRQIQDINQHHQGQLRSMQQENQQLRKLVELKNQQLQRGSPQRGQTSRTHTQDLQSQLQRLQLSEDQHQTVVKKKPPSKVKKLKWRERPEHQTCTICFTEPQNTALLCGHKLCWDCAQKKDHCPVCRKFVTHRIRLTPSDPNCPICLTEPLDTALLCGHQLCWDCAQRVDHCPEVTCRKFVTHRIRLTPSQATGSGGLSDSAEPACSICLTESRNTSLLCGHKLCWDCAQKVDHCPICRKFVTHRIHLKSSPDSNCPICLTEPLDTALLCGHQLCWDCAQKVDHCPVCRKFVTHRICLTPSQATGNGGLSDSAEPACLICLTEPRNTALLCGHKLCWDCAQKVDHCPICRKFVTHRIRLKSSPDSNCPICLTEPLDTALLCGHQLCWDCAQRVDHCPEVTCWKFVTHRIRLTPSQATGSGDLSDSAEPACPMCRTESRNTTLLCGHQLCWDCAQKVDHCPVTCCRKFVAHRIRLKSSPDSNCPICFTELQNTALLCGHKLCWDCAQKVDHCPICRKFVTHRIRLFQ